jgi:hypothetical protein
MGSASKSTEQEKYRKLARNAGVFRSFFFFAKKALSIIQL